MLTRIRAWPTRFQSDASLRLGAGEEASSKEGSPLQDQPLRRLTLLGRIGWSWRLQGYLLLEQHD